MILQRLSIFLAAGLLLLAAVLSACGSEPEESSTSTEAAQSIADAKPTETNTPVAAAAPTETTKPVAATAPTETVRPVAQAQPAASTPTATTPPATSTPATPTSEPSPTATTDTPTPASAPSAGDKDMTEYIKSLDIKTLLGFDAIPAILEPTFVDADEADEWFNPESLVLGLSIDGDHRAYSIPLLSRHEIVNDTVGGQPVAVTW